MRPIGSPLCALIAGLFATGCRDATSVAPSVPLDAPFTTDSSLYHAVAISPTQFGFTVVTRCRNSTTVPIELTRCYPDSPSPIYSVQFVGSSATGGNAYNPGWACVGHDTPIVVAAGATRIDTLRLRGPNFFDGHTGAGEGALEGIAQIGYGGAACPTPSTCVDAGDSLRVSNTFTVRLVR